MLIEISKVPVVPTYLKEHISDRNWRAKAYRIVPALHLQAARVLIPFSTSKMLFASGTAMRGNVVATASRL